MRCRIPTHDDKCKKKRSFKTKCRCCKYPVIYYECTSGSKVFLDMEGGDHNCSELAKAIQGYEKQGMKKAKIYDKVVADFEFDKKGVPDEYKNLIYGYLGQQELF